jgi:hypothetical protein
MPSPQALSEADRRLVAAWAADCAERADSCRSVKERENAVARCGTRACSWS